MAGTYTVIATNTTGNCTSNMVGSAVVTVTPTATPTVGISANPGTTTCAGNPVIFTATPTNGGATPHYQWKLNGNDVGLDSPSYTNSSLVNGDQIFVVLTTSVACATSPTTNSPTLTMTITASVTPLVTVAASPGTNVCDGATVIFTATPVNGGSSPTYVWKTNGVQDTSVPAGSATYTNSSLAHGDLVDCRLLSNDPCAAPTLADAPTLTMTVTANVTPSVTIAANPGSTICAGSPVTFTPTPVNGGASPTYQWRTNGVPVPGETGATFTSSLLRNSDVVTVVVTPSSDICVSPATATSGGISMTVNALPTMTLGGSYFVCTGAMTAALTYSGTTGSPDQYSLTFDSAALTAGFANVPLTTLPASPIVVAVPSPIALATYNGTLVVKNSGTGCSSTGMPFMVTIVALPSAAITAPGGVCASSSGNTATVPDAGTIASGASYAWTISGGTFTSPDPQTNRVTFTADASGTVVLGCTVTSSNGCVSPAAGSATIAINAATTTPYVMATGNYFENFSDIASWNNGFLCGNGANRWSPVAVNASGTIPDGKRTTVSSATFSSGSSGGVQRGSSNMVFLSTGGAGNDNLNACAVDLLLDFTGRGAGTLSFDWAEVNNSSGDRASSLRVYTSTDGTTFTELTAALVTVTNNVAFSGTKSALLLPASFANSPTARIRFYSHTGTGGTTPTGSRPKISVDNVTVTTNQLPVAAATNSPCTPTLSVSIQITGAGGLATDPDGDALTVTTTGGTAGSNFVFSAGGAAYILYQNTNAAAASDSFDYTVSDGRGGSNTATITITLAQPGGQTLNSLGAPEVIGAGPDVRLKFLGIPGYEYALELTHSLTPPITWTPVLTNTASGDGHLSFTNTPSGGSDFYRTRWVP